MKTGINRNLFPPGFGVRREFAVPEAGAPMMGRAHSGEKWLWTAVLQDAVIQALSRNNSVGLGSAGVSPASFGVSPKASGMRDDALNSCWFLHVVQSAGRRLVRPGRSRSPFAIAWFRLTERKCL